MRVVKFLMFFAFLGLSSGLYGSFERDDAFFFRSVEYVKRALENGVGAGEIEAKIRRFNPGMSWFGYERSVEKPFFGDVSEMDVDEHHRFRTSPNFPLKLRMIREKRVPRGISLEDFIRLDVDSIEKRHFKPVSYSFVESIDPAEFPRLFRSGIVEYPKVLGAFLRVILGYVDGYLKSRSNDSLVMILRLLDSKHGSAFVEISRFINIKRNREDRALIKIFSIAPGESPVVAAVEMLREFVNKLMNGSKVGERLHSVGRPFRYRPMTKEIKMSYSDKVNAEKDLFGKRLAVLSAELRKERDRLNSLNISIDILLHMHLVDIIIDDLILLLSKFSSSSLLVPGDYNEVVTFLSSVESKYRDISSGRISSILENAKHKADSSRKVLLGFLKVVSEGFNDFRIGLGNRIKLLDGSGQSKVIRDIAHFTSKFIRNFISNFSLYQKQLDRSLEKESFIDRASDDAVKFFESTASGFI